MKKENATVKPILEELTLTKEWDKVFPQNDKVKHRKITFMNRYGITLAADLYQPKQNDGKLAALAICGPFGAVKEQSSGLYAQTLAACGFLTLAFDPSFTGESGGRMRNVASLDINTEDFCAAVDYLSSLEETDPEQIGIIGICGWGGLAIQAATLDTRIKVTIASTMYDMHRIATNGYFDSEKDADHRYGLLETLNKQRSLDTQSDVVKRDGGCIAPEDLTDDMPDFVKQYTAYYKTSRGFHPRSLNSNGGWNATTTLSQINMPLLLRADEIRNAVLIVHGAEAHSRYMGEDAFRMLKGSNKKLLIVPHATHTDLYDQMDKIPFKEIEAFIRSHINENN